MADAGTAALTAAFGAAVFVVGQSVQRFLLEPVQEQRRVIGEVAYAVLMYSNINHVEDVRARGLAVSWVKEPEEVVRELRDLAARLQASLYVIPAYRLLGLLHIALPKRRALAAIKWLTGWSNSIYSGDAMAAQDKVVLALRIVRNP